MARLRRGPALRRLVLIAGGALLVVASGEAVRWALSRGPATLELDIGPSTGMYLDGFTESEERMPATFRWTREHATVRLPVSRRGGGSDSRSRLTIRYARFLPGNAVVRVFVDGAPAASFSARSGRFRTQTHELTLPEGGGREALRLKLLVEDPSQEKLGIAVDWIVLEEMRFSLLSWAPRLFLLALVVLGCAVGFSLPTVLVAGSVVAAFQAVAFSLAPLATAHLHEQIAASAIVTTGLVYVWMRERRVALLFLVSFLLKGSALFHPSYFYPDVRLHRRHLEAFNRAEGGIVARGIAAQHEANTAYPRLVAGKPYAFPYSPVFYLPFTLVEGDARAMEALMKHVGLLLAALELPLVFLLARFLFSARAALWAAFLAAFLPPLTSRLLFAQWPTLAGHVLDVVALSAAARLVAAPGERRALAAYVGSAFTSCLTYISSLLNLTLLTACLAFALPKARIKLLVAGGGVALATTLLLYRPFLRVFFTEIGPALIEHGGSGSPGAGIATTLSHVYIFYGLGFTASALAGLWLAKGRSETSFRFLWIYGASFLGLLALRASVGMFKDLKDLIYVGPFIAITCAVFLDTLSEPTRMRRASALAVAAGLAAFAIAKHLDYVAMHTSLAGF